MTTGSSKAKSEDIKGVGSDAKILIELVGERGRTHRINLDNFWRNDFEDGNTDAFNVKGEKVGEIYAIRFWN